MNIHRLYDQIFRFTRRRRMLAFDQLMQPTNSQTVVDVGGSTFNWQFIPEKPRVVLVNVEPAEETASLPEQFSFERGDGRALAYDSGQFDIAYSNSVIEHVGGWGDQQRFAAEMRRVGRKVWVQTPAREFPIEPHFLAPFLHWFSKSWQHLLVRWLSLRCWLERRSREQAHGMVDEIRLLSRGEFAALFPDCEIITERFCFWPKSYIAVRR